MRMILALLFPLLIFIKSDERKIQTIRFVYVGEELKPHGTLLISVGKYIVPSDKGLDSFFGRGIKTDEKTFEFINTFVHNNKYTLNNRKKISDLETVYVIICPKRVEYLREKDFESFFDDLRSGLQEKNLDRVVIEAFRNYNSSWK